jgi:hypothetical protein
LKPAAVCLGLALLNLVLQAPVFWPGETPFRGSIEPGYASTARFFAQHPDPWGWNPLYYFGLPTQFTYLPLVPYLAAAASWALPGYAMTDVYRAVVSVFGVLAPSVFFLLAWFALRSVPWALAVGLASSLVSPAYVFSQVGINRGTAYLPWRLQVLVKFGEGPHTVGLFLLPLALIAVYRAATRKRYSDVWLAAVAMAAVTLSSWVAGLALAFCCLLLMLAMRGSDFSHRHTMGAALLAYGMACFWLTPTFVRTTLLNWPVDSLGYEFQARQALLLAGWLAGVAGIHWACRRWLPGERWLEFFIQGAWVFGYVVTFKYGRGIDVIPEPHRYAPEAELFLMLAMAGAAKWGLARNARWLRIAAAVCLVLSVLAGARQVKAMTTQGFAIRRQLDRETLAEYRIARFLEGLEPRGRIFASGAFRFGLNSWVDLPQVSGVFESGLQNRIAMDFDYLVRVNESGAECVKALRAAGVEYVVVHGPQSKEFYRDIRPADKFEGLLEKVYDEGDDRIYRVPFDSWARAVRPEEPAAWPQFTLGSPDRPHLVAHWEGPSAIRIEGRTPDGLAIALPVTHDSGWQAMQGGAPVPVERDPQGFLLVLPKPGADGPVLLRFRAGAEPRVCAAVSGVVWAASLLGLAIRRRRA